MISKFILTAALIGLVGCASSNPQSEPNPPKANANAEAEAKAVDSSEDSQILSKQKCPKHSTLVDGKCVLQVESDD